MAHFADVLIGAAVAVMAAGAVMLRRHRAAEPLLDDAAPRSLVRVLRSEEELREAVDKAVRFERMLADSVETRTRRYQALLSAAPLRRLDPDAAGRSAIHDDAVPRSA